MEEAGSKQLGFITASEHIWFRPLLLLPRRFLSHCDGVVAYYGMQVLLAAESGVTHSTHKHRLSLSLWSCGSHTGLEDFEGAAAGAEANSTVSAVPPLLQHRERCSTAGAVTGGIGGHTLAEFLR